MENNITLIVQRRTTNKGKFTDLRLEVKDPLLGSLNVNLNKLTPEKILEVLQGVNSVEEVNVDYTEDDSSPISDETV